MHNVNVQVEVNLSGPAGGGAEAAAASGAGAGAGGRTAAAGKQGVGETKPVLPPWMLRPAGGADGSGAGGAGTGAGADTKAGLAGGSLGDAEVEERQKAYVQAYMKAMMEKEQERQLQQQQVGGVGSQGRACRKGQGWSSWWFLVDTVYFHTHWRRLWMDCRGQVEEGKGISSCRGQPVARTCFA